MLNKHRHNFAARDTLYKKDAFNFFYILFCMLFIVCVLVIGSWCFNNTRQFPTASFRFIPTITASCQQGNLHYSYSNMFLYKVDKEGNYIVISGTGDKLKLNSSCKISYTVLSKEVLD